MKNISLALLLALMSALIGCAPAYIPNAVNVPLLSNQGQFQGAVSVGSSGTDFQTSYALTSNLGLMANGSFYEGTLTDNADATVVDKTKRIFFEGGAGYYTAFGSAGRFETYGGYGQGTSTYSNSYDFFGPQEVIATGNYRRFFIQPSIGTATDFFDAAISLRTCYVNFYQIKSGDLSLDHNVDGIFMEPVITARLGYKHLKFMAQIGATIPLGQDVEMFWHPFLFNLGLSFDFGKKERTTENK
ncbi:MAG: hypothetical protein Q7U71_08240 [bacterium]|nr:hypothetical protein [bacterium]